MQFSQSFLRARGFHLETGIPESVIREAIRNGKLAGFYSGKWFWINCQEAWKYFTSLGTTPAA